MFRISRNRSGVVSRELGRGVILTLLAVGSQAGCTREFYREWANQDVSEAVFEKSRDPRWRLDLFSIEPPALSRFADPYDPDFPPAPPDDEAAEALSPVPQWPDNRLIVPDRGHDHLEMMEDWMRERDAARAAGKINYHDLRGARATGRGPELLNRSQPPAPPQDSVSVRPAGGHRGPPARGGSPGSGRHAYADTLPPAAGPPGRRAPAARRAGTALPRRRGRRAAGHGAFGQGFAEASGDEFRDRSPKFVANTLSETRSAEKKTAIPPPRPASSFKSGESSRAQGVKDGSVQRAAGQAGPSRVQPRRTGLASPCNRRKLDLAKKG